LSRETISRLKSNLLTDGQEFFGFVLCDFDICKFGCYYNTRITNTQNRSQTNNLNERKGINKL